MPTVCQAIARSCRYIWCLGHYIRKQSVQHMHALVTDRITLSWLWPSTSKLCGSHSDYVVGRINSISQSFGLMKGDQAWGNVLLESHIDPEVVLSQCDCWSLEVVLWLNNICLAWWSVWSRSYRAPNCSCMKLTCTWPAQCSLPKWSTSGVIYQDMTVLADRSEFLQFSMGLASDSSSSLAETHRIYSKHQRSLWSGGGTAPGKCDPFWRGQ